MYPIATQTGSNAIKRIIFFLLSMVRVYQRCHGFYNKLTIATHATTVGTLDSFSQGVVTEVNPSFQKEKKRKGVGQE